MSMIPGEGVNLTKMGLGAEDVKAYMKSLGEEGDFELPIRDYSTVAGGKIGYVQKGDYNILVMFPFEGRNFSGTTAYRPDIRNEWLDVKSKGQVMMNEYERKNQKERESFLSNEMDNARAATVYVHNMKENIMSVYGIGIGPLGVESIEIQGPTRMKDFVDTFHGAMIGKGAEIFDPYPVPELDQIVGRATSDWKKMVVFKESYQKDRYQIPKDLVGNPNSVSKMAAKVAGEFCQDIFRERALEK